MNYIINEITTYKILYITRNNSITRINIVYNIHMYILYICTYVYIIQYFIV